MHDKMTLVEESGENLSNQSLCCIANENNMIQYKPRVNFSLRKEIFFVTISSLIGAIAMFVPRIIFDVTINTQYYLAWLVFAKILEIGTYLSGTQKQFWYVRKRRHIFLILILKSNFYSKIILELENSDDGYKKINERIGNGTK